MRLERYALRGRRFEFRISGKLELSRKGLPEHWATVDGHKYHTSSKRTSGAFVELISAFLCSGVRCAASVCPVEERPIKPYHRARDIVYLHAEALGRDWGVHSSHPRQLGATHSRSS